MKRHYYILLCFALLIVSASASAQTDIVEKVSQLSAENATLKAEIRRLKADSTYNAHRHKIDSIRYEQKLSDKNKELSATKQELQKLRTSQSAGKIQAAERKAEDLQKKLDKANADYGAMVAKKDGEIAALNKKISELHQLLTTNSNNDARLKQQENIINEYKRTVSDKEDQIIRWKAIVSDRDMTIKQLQTKLEKYE